LTVLPQVEAKGTTRNISDSLGLHLRQSCQLLTLEFLFLKN